MQNALNTICSIAISFGFKLIAAAIVLFVGFKLIKVLVNFLGKRDFFTKLDSNVQLLIRNAITVLLDVIVVIICVEILGVPSATIIAVLGSCGLAIGLALQGGLANIAGGVIIMLFKPFHAGDFISTPMGDGTVEDIGIFYTKLVTPDNVGVNIPNSVLSNSTVSNLSAKDTRRIDIELSIAYDADIDLAKKVLLASAESHDLVLKDPAPAAFVTSQADSAVKLTLRVWVEKANYWDVKFGLTEDSKKAFDQFGISIPFPQLDVHVKNN
ncbi:MAG: mechanosensitive ion channel family protein [Clostridia bacterium]|nr:mechanosensitive ion channel family protein [Clostridia bacterium]